MILKKELLKLRGYTIMMNRSIRFFTLIVLCSLNSALHADFESLHFAYNHAGKIAAEGCVGAYAAYRFGNTLKKKARKHAPLLIGGTITCYVLYKYTRDEELRQLTINGFREVLKGINQLRADVANGFARVENQLNEIQRRQDVLGKKSDRNSQQIGRNGQMLEAWLRHVGLENEIPPPIESQVPTLNTIPVTIHDTNIQPDEVNFQASGSGGYVERGLNWVTQNSPASLAQFINRFT